MAAEKYRRLPGRRRGVIRGSSVWLGSDHLLSVKSMRFREEYKRFYFRDVQGIAVARAMRFHISTRSLFLAWVWAGLYGVASATQWPYIWIVWYLGVALIVAWLVASSAFSCRCRLYTAVSREELPSVYRTWTAQKFLDRVTPQIAQVQGAVPEDWAEAAEAMAARPSDAPPAPAPQTGESRPTNARLHTLAADIFIASLFAAALGDLALLRSTAPLATSTDLGIQFVLLVESVVLFVQYFRGLLQAPMQRLAVANLVYLGVMYYARQLMVGFNYGATAGKATLKLPTFYTGGSLTRGIDCIVCIILGLVGLGIIFLRAEGRGPSRMNL
jgi:hypothetical protein